MHSRLVTILSMSLFGALLLWGGYTLLYYIGVPAHLQILTSEATRESLATLCSADGHFCRGAYAVLSAVWHVLTKESVFLWYTAVCAVLFGLSILWQYCKHGNTEVQWTVRPWKLVLLFLGMIWLLFTCLTLSQKGTVPLRIIVEPIQEVYTTAGPEAMEALKRNYASLQERGCLTRVGTFADVAEASRISMRCLQGSFFTRILPQFLLALVFLFELAIAGRLVLRRLLRIKPKDRFAELLFSIALGAGAFIVLLWIGAVFHIYTPLYGWLLALLVPVIGFRHALYWMEQFLGGGWEFRSKWHGLYLLLAWFLFSYLALNFINVIRPFPIGWDDLGSYLNRPRLLVSYGAFVHSMATFQWEYLTSLGFLLFGFNSTFGATASLIINWTQGLIALLAVMLFGRTFLGAGRGLLSGALYYTLPLVGHFSFADMKIDNAVFLAGTLATLALFIALFKREELQHPLRWFALAGVLAAFAFSFKVTAVMLLMALAATLAGALLHWSAFVGLFMASIAIFIQQGGLRLPTIFERLAYGYEATANQVILWCATIAGILLLIAFWLGRKNARTAVLSGAIFLAGFAVVILPWVTHNNIQHGKPLTTLSLGSPNKLTPRIDMFGDYRGQTPYSLPPELAVDKMHEHCKATAAKEELDRYWGSQTGWSHYLTLPWRAVMNLDHVGYYVTVQPALLLFPLVLLLPFFWRPSGRWARWMWIGTLYLLVQWGFMANGVLWYGIGMFLGLVLLLEVLVARSPDVFSRTTASVLVCMSLVICLGMRFWQFETQRNMFEYPLGKIGADTLRERTIPYYDDITEIVMHRRQTVEGRPLLYRIGTFMPYFVPKNLEVIGVTDHQLDFFNCLHQDRDIAKTRARLKALGFNSLVFDTNTATIEKDPNGSLHQKVQALVDFINHPDAGMQLVINDPGAGIAYMLIP